MHDFKYKGKELYCEDVKLADLAREYGTPLYVYSHKTLTGHYHKLRRAFKSVDPLICFSVKSNSNIAVARALVNEGSGLDIVSGGELFRALKAGCPPEKIVYASVGKTRQEIVYAVKSGILLFNVESIPELSLISEVAQSLRTEVDVALRVNPDVDAHTHKYITTAKKASKFGIDIQTVKWIFANKALFSNVRVSGLHMHIGSQIVKSGPFIEALKKVVGLILSLREDGHELKWLNIGGGLGIIYNKEKPQRAQEYANAALPLLKKSGLKIILEPGRFISGNSGVLISRVTYVKETKEKRFIIIDAGMNDLVRPALYEAYHDILPLSRKPAVAKADIVGPICESGDFLAKDRKLADFKPGDLLSVMSAGAYGFSMSSNYNSRPRAAEIMVFGREHYLIRERETYDSLISGEKIPGRFAK